MGQPATKSSDLLIDRLDELPTLPTIVYELSQIINDPMSSTGDIESVMANDQSMTTKVLKLANSAYYAIPGGVTSLSRAIGYIGYDTIHQLVLSASIINALQTKGPTKFDLNQFWKHSLGVAMISETIARAVGYKAPSDLFTCRLVHDMGKVALLILAPDLFEASQRHAQDSQLSMAEAEEAIGNPRHTMIGFELASRWRLPLQIQTVAKQHHEKDPARRVGLSQELNMVVDIVLLANLLAHALQFGNSGHQKVMGAPKALLERLGVTSEQLKELLEDIKESLKNADGFLKIIGG